MVLTGYKGDLYLWDSLNDCKELWDSGDTKDMVDLIIANPYFHHKSIVVSTLPEIMTRAEESEVVIKSAAKGSHDLYQTITSYLSQ